MANLGNVAGKKVAVIGASGRLGLALVDLLHQRGAELHVSVASEYELSDVESYCKGLPMNHANNQDEPKAYKMAMKEPSSTLLEMMSSGGRDFDALVLNTTSIKLSIDDYHFASKPTSFATQEELIEKFYLSHVRIVDEVMRTCASLSTVCVFLPAIGLGQDMNNTKRARAITPSKQAMKAFFRSLIKELVGAHQAEVLLIDPDDKVEELILQESDEFDLPEEAVLNLIGNI